MPNGSLTSTFPPADELEIRFPDTNGESQDEEFCEVVIDGEPRRIRFHDYGEIYSIPGLYERLFYRDLRCQSPRMVREAIAETIERPEIGIGKGSLRVLDVGAGNGMVGEELERIGTEALVGVDIIPEAAEAAARDRPRLYDEYHVVDLTEIPGEVDERLAARDFNCMTTVAALGFGDIPPEAFAGAYAYVREGGLVALSIKSEFVAAGDGSGFARLISRAIDAGTLKVADQRRFTHRLSATGEPLTYDAIVATKHGDLPEID